MARSLRTVCLAAVLATLGAWPAAAQFNPFESLFGRPPPRPPAELPAGRAPAPQPQADPARRTIAVNVDRSERRQAIPHQPARTAVPPQADTQSASVVSTRKAAVTQIMKNRGHRIVV